MFAFQVGSDEGLGISTFRKLPHLAERQVGLLCFPSSEAAERQGPANGFFRIKLQAPFSVAHSAALCATLCLGGG